MSDQESVKAALEAAASHPKVSSAVAVATVAMGTSSVVSQLQTVLGIISLAIGCCVGFYVLRINSIKSKIYQRMLDDGESLGD